MISIALVGDRSPAVRAHSRIPVILDALREEERIDLDAYWIPTEEATDPVALIGFAGVWLLPGSPYRSEAGAVTAARVARTAGIPFLGTCGGFQHAMLEFARDVCGLTSATHAENGDTGDDPLIAELSCSLVGHEGAINLAPGSRIERLLGTGRTIERYHCSYGIAAGYIDLLAAHGMRFTGHDDAGEVRVAELGDHPFFLATLFQPELHTDGVHPVIRGFAQAVAARATAPA
ncbi:CTP synthase C-terminal region-related (seleno)protein [Actinoplanes sp. CA-030573]|uniref:CTP synthase C-terminal region-related (seleno)protein n=1 Tax=Actinoplanes sp. CA-030573 TaxID=3239898 RepID=UPI003D907286